MHTRKWAIIAIIAMHTIFLNGCATAKPDAETEIGKIDIDIGKITDSTIEITIRNETNKQLAFWDVEIRQMDSGNQKILRKHARLSCKEESQIIKEGATEISPFSTFTLTWDRKDQGCNIVNPRAIQVQTWSVGYIKDSKILTLPSARGKQSGYLQSDVIKLPE